MKIKELLSDESKWCKNTYAKDQFGSGVRSTDPSAVCWCLAGAIYKCYGDFWQGIDSKIRNEIKEEGVAEFNDKNDFKTIKELVERLDI